MQKTYQHPAREIPVYGEYDVIVAGGGPAGCAAAVASARLGAKTLLLEKDAYLGGATVSQNVLVILSTNAVDFQGIWHEYMDRLKARGGVYEDEFHHSPAQFYGAVDPEVVKYAWDDLLGEAGVKILHHAPVIDVIRDGKKILGVVAATKAGHRAFYARRVVDATGDGIVCEYAGVPWEQGANGNKYAMALTKAFRLGNVEPDAGPANEQEVIAMKENLRLACERGEYKHPLMASGRASWYICIKHLIWRLPRHRREVDLVTSRILRCDPLDPDEITRAEREGRQQVWEVADFFKKYVPGCGNTYLVDSGAHVGVRSSRRVKGIATATENDAKNFVKYEDGIAKSSWDIDVWPSDSYVNPAVDRGSDEHNSRLVKLQHGEYFDIRYGCIVAAHVENLFMAGRIISAEHLAESSLRIQQTCMSTGEAAGTAAALSIRANTPPHALDPAIVVNALNETRSKTQPAFRLIAEAWKCFENGGSIRDLKMF